MNNQILGHKKQLELLQKAVQNNAHQSFLFSGPESVGKYTIARALAQNIITQTDNYKWDICTNAESDINIIMPLQEEKKKKIIIKDISIDQIKQGIRFLTLTPDKYGRILIIDDAHRMTTNAQNALLKTLEEPQQNRFIILVTHSSDNLLSTIYSRCLHLQFNILDDDELYEMCKSDEYIGDVGGSPGYLKNMQTNEEFREKIKYAREMLQSFFSKKTYEHIQLASKLSKQNDEHIQLFLRVWIYRIRAGALAVQKLSLLKIADDVENVLHKIQTTNVNKKLILEDLFIRMTK